MNSGTLFCFSLGLLLIIRIISVLLSRRKHIGITHPTCRVAVFLGSGGHTSEMLQMMKGLDLERYEPRLYIVSEGDQFSAEKAAEFETGGSFPEAFSVTTIPRARKVLQPIWTVPFTAAISLFICVKEFTLKPWLQGKPFADLLLLNGPGTCIPLFATVFLNRVLGMESPRVIYIESFTRVKTLSLSGRILRPLVDRFVVQWPNLTRKGGKERYSGWLI